MNHFIELLQQLMLLWNLCEIRFLAITNIYPYAFPFSSFSLFPAPFFKCLNNWFNRIVILPNLVDVTFQKDSNETETWSDVLRWVLMGNATDVATFLIKSARFIALSIKNPTNSCRDIEYSIITLANMLALCPRLVNEVDFNNASMVKWQRSISCMLYDPNLGNHTEISCLIDIVAGQGESQWKAQTRAAGHWSHLFIAQLLYTSSLTVDNVSIHTSGYIVDSFRDLSDLLSKVTEWWKTIDQVEFSPFEECVIAIVKGNVPKVINLIDSIISIPLCTAHLVDLLSEVTPLPVESEGQSIQEYHILNYAHTLAYNESLWKLSLEYYEHCGTIGAANIRNLICHYSTRTSNDKTLAFKLLHLCDVYTLPSERSIVIKFLIQNSLSFINNLSKSSKPTKPVESVAQLGEAFYWMVLGKDFETISKVSLLLLNLYFDSRITIESLAPCFAPMKAFYSISYEFDFLTVFYEFRTKYFDGPKILGGELLVMSNLLVTVKKGTIPLPFRMPLLKDISLVLNWQYDQYDSEKHASSDDLFTLFQFLESTLSRCDQKIVKKYCDASTIDNTRTTLNQIMALALIS